MKKIIIIGPTYPYKGGIAHYTEAMFNSLSEAFDVQLISYKLQYPKLLFKAEQKHYDEEHSISDRVQFILNTVNPFNCISVGSRLKKQAPDLVIIQWWHPYFVPSVYLLLKGLGKKIPIVFVCHNVLPHERFPLDSFITRLALKRGNYFIVHSQQEADDLKSFFQAPKILHTVHPTYANFNTNLTDRTQARKKLGLKQDERLLLFFGFVREYKGLKNILNALPLVLSKLNCRLVIAGSFSGDKEEYLKLIEQLGIKENVVINDGYISDSDMNYYFTACDLVVLPYNSATQSGVVQLAFGFERPVLVTNVGGLAEVVDNNETGYVITKPDKQLISDSILDFFENDRAEYMSTNIRLRAGRFSWSVMVDNISHILEEL